MCVFVLPVSHVSCGQKWWTFLSEGVGWDAQRRALRFGESGWVWCCCSQLRLQAALTSWRQWSWKLGARLGTNPSAGHLTQRGGQQSSPIHLSLTACLNSGLLWLLTTSTTFLSYWQSCLCGPAGLWKIYHTFAQISCFGNVERPWNSTVPSEHTPLIRKQPVERREKTKAAKQTGHLLEAATKVFISRQRAGFFHRKGCD